MGELEVERALGALAARNAPAGAGPFFCGAGAYRHHVPASVDHLIQRSEFLTSYTPYQPEIAQGTLQVLFEFQTQVAALTGLPVANASMYDGSTACAEAVMMAARVTGAARRCSPAACTRTTPRPLDAGPLRRRRASAPGRRHRRRGRGDRRDRRRHRLRGGADPQRVRRRSDVTRRIAEAGHAAGALLVVVTTEAVSFGLLKSPGEMGADIAVAEGQSIGNALNFGGPYVGLFACREQFVRQMPGRLCGETVDAEGRRGFVLTLSTREQHIRREKATSNICTNSGLCALAFTIHMSLLGEAGLRQLARDQPRPARQLRDALAAVPGRRGADAALLQRVRGAAAEARGRGGRGPGRRAASSPACRSRRLDPDARGWTTCCWSAPPRPPPTPTSPPSPKPLARGACPMSALRAGRPTRPKPIAEASIATMTSGRGLCRTSR